MSGFQSGAFQSGAFQGAAVSGGPQHVSTPIGTRRGRPVTATGLNFVVGHG